VYLDENKFETSVNTEELLDILSRVDTQEKTMESLLLRSRKLFCEAIKWKQQEQRRECFLDKNNVGPHTGLKH